MTQQRKDEIGQAVYEMLKENNLYHEVYWYHDLPVLSIDVDGDWKHDHARTRFLVGEFFQRVGLDACYMGEYNVTDTGCDWYAATHRWIISA